VNDLTAHCVNNGTNYEEVRKRIDDINPYKQDIYKKRDDLSLSRLFSVVFKDQARFNATAREWFYYDGKVWKRDTGSMNVEQYAKTFIKALQVYAVTKTEDQDFQKFLSRYGDRPNRKRMIEDARDFNFIEQEDFDQDPDLFNCQNCVIRLSTRERLPHDSTLLLSKISNVYYDPDVRSEDFDQFIHQVLMNDDQKINYLQRVFGYALTGENTQEQCYMCYGSSTRNGKSTLLDVIGYMFGDYGMNIKPETLAQKDRDSRSASGDIARLDGCRFLHMSEPPKKMKFDVALLKTLIGRDVITARNLYEREFEFIPVFKLVINTNFLPVVTDDTLFSSERVKVITFDRHFNREEQDRQLKGRLKRNKNLTGIFNWCLDGLRAFYDEGGVLVEPDCVIKATEDYRKKSDKIQNFIDDCLELSPGSNIKIKESYNVFEIWCRENGFGTENKSNFTEEIKAKGMFSKTATINGQTVRNIIKDYKIREEYLNFVPVF